MTCMHCTPSENSKIQLESYDRGGLKMKSIQKNVVNGKFLIPKKFSFCNLLT